MSKIFGATGICLLCLLGGPAQAATFAVAGTGTDLGSNVLPGGSLDDHYTWTGPAGSGTAVVYSAPAIWGQWVPDSSTSAWIGHSDSGDTRPYGDYSYSISFSLAGYNAATASLMGRWAADQDGSIDLNGVPTGISVADGNWCSCNAPNLNAFSITSGFKSGTNTLTFIVNEPDGFDGLRVDPMTVTATVAVPETGALGMMVLGMGVLVPLVRRRRA